MGQQQHRWTAAEDQVLRRLFGKFDRAEVAARMGMTPGQVKARAKRLRIVHPRWSTEDEQRLRELIPTGTPWDAVTSTVRDSAAAFGRSPEAVLRKARALGLIERQTFKWTPQAEWVLREMHTAGETNKAIMFRLGIASKYTVMLKRQELGLSTLYGVRGRPPFQDHHLKSQSDRVRATWRDGTAPLIDYHLRARGFERELAASYNLPADLPPRAVAVLLLLLDGPATACQIAAALGRDATKAIINPLKVSAGNRRSVSVTKFLLTRGLIAYMPRFFSGKGSQNGKRGGSTPGLYILTLSTAEMIANAQRRGVP